jgi:hypothetical protein
MRTIDSIAAVMPPTMIKVDVEGYGQTRVRHSGINEWTGAHGKPKLG